MNIQKPQKILFEINRLEKVVTLDDIKGAIINEYQAIDLIRIIGVKIKEQ